MAKIPLDYEFGDSVIVVYRTTVQQLFTTPDGDSEIVTDAGVYMSNDADLIGVFPDPNED